MIQIAVLGFGVVGSGVVEILRKSKDLIINKVGEEIGIKHILDVRDFAEHPERMIITKDPELIFNDPDVKIIVETIGGKDKAYEFTKRALLSGRHVVTSNKELVASHGPELLEIAKKNNLNYLFEASVGGGIPIIKPLHGILSSNKITSIMGILNGTTNYILTSMYQEGKSFDSALKDAQLKGFAEANPAADIEGYDSSRKIAILSSIAYGQYVNYNEIPTEGISKITYDDLKAARSINHKIKLIAQSRKEDGKIIARVSPVILEQSHALANVEGVYNAILVSGDAIGDVMFYGEGAGKLPTASAVVGDVIDICKKVGVSFDYSKDSDQKNSVEDSHSIETKYFVRVRVRNINTAKSFISQNFEGAELMEIPEDQNQLAFKTSKAKEKVIQQKIQNINGIGSISEVLTSLRVL